MSKKNEPKPSGAPAKKLILILLLLAAVVRIWNMPRPDEVRDWDELGYETDGLMAWEGLSPGWEGVPAGPQTWVSWLYVGGRTGLEFLHSQTKAATPTELRFISAMDRALFKTYENLGPLRQLLLWISIAVSLAGVYGAYRLGERYGGPAGGFLLGGLTALLPLYVEFAGVAKTCSDAWMFAILAISCAATLNGRKRTWWAGIMLGLAIGSRIDMVLTTPLVLWALWDNPEKESVWSSMLGILSLSLATALLSAPFAMQGFMAILRQIATAGGSTYWGSAPQRLRTLKEIGVDQGIGPVFAGALLGYFLLPAEKKWKRIVLGVFGAVTAASLFMRHYQPFRYNGAQLIIILVFIAVGAGALFRRWPRAAFALAILFLAWPAIQSVRAASTARSGYAPDKSAEWIDAHIPPGTTVYLHPGWISRAVLPTEAAADAIWAVVSGNEAWRTKYEDGFRRFHLEGGRLPRALSEDNLCKDRAICRRWFILGGGESSRPRYNVILAPMSTTFGLTRRTVWPAFQKTGGVLIWPTRASGPPEDLPAGIGEPFMKWVNSQGDGVWLYVSPDLRKQIAGQAVEQSAALHARNSDENRHEY